MTEGRVLVLAESFDHFAYWCGIQQPRENPKDRKFVVITPDTMRRGLHHGWIRQEGDRLIRLNAAPYDWPGHYEGEGDDMQYVTPLMMLNSVLMPGGWNISEAERVTT